MFTRHEKLKLTKPQFAFIVGTRAVLATGIAMLVAGRIPPRIRRGVGIGLVALGAATTIPAARALLRA